MYTCTCMNPSNLFSCAASHLPQIFTYMFCSEVVTFACVYDMHWGAHIWERLANTLPYNHPTVACTVAQYLSARRICKSWRRNNLLAVLISDRRWVSDRKYLAVVQPMTVWRWWHAFPFYSPNNYSDKCNALQVRQQLHTNRSYLLTWQKWPRAVPFPLLLAYYFVNSFDAGLPPHMATWVVTCKILVLVYDNN